MPSTTFPRMGPESSCTTMASTAAPQHSKAANLNNGIGDDMNENSQYNEIAASLHSHFDMPQTPTRTALLLACTAVVCAGAAITESLVVKTSSGPIVGAPGAQGTAVFLGVPFASPPVGPLRWYGPAAHPFLMHALQLPAPMRAAVPLKRRNCGTWGRLLLERHPTRPPQVVDCWGVRDTAAVTRA